MATHTIKQFKFGDDIYQFKDAVSGYTTEHYNAKNVIASSATGQSDTTTALTNGHVYLNLIENETVRSSHNIVGAGVISVITDANGNLVITSDTEGEGGGTIISAQIQATSPVVSSDNSVQTSTFATTISLADYYGDTKNPYSAKSAHQVLIGPTSGSAVPTFRALAVSDIPDLSGTYLTANSTLNASKVSGTLPASTYTNTTYSNATNSVSGLVQPWIYHSVASVGTGGTNSTAVTVNEASTTEGKYYAVETDVNGRLFVNVPWTDTNIDTHYTANLYTGASASATVNEAASGNVYLNLVENNTIRNSHLISGAGGTTVSSDESGNVTISSLKKYSLSVVLPVENWSNNSQSVSATGVDGTNTVFITAAQSSKDEYRNCQIQCTTQASNSLTFSCTTVPSSDIVINVTALTD